jgi:hypothetical protein
LANYDNVLREKEAESRRLAAELAEARRPKPENGNVDPAAELLANPRKLIQEEINIGLAPIRSFIAGIQGNDTYSQLKARWMGSNPNDAENFKRFEREIDHVMKTSNAPMTPEALTFAFSAIIGAAYREGKLNQTSNTPSNREENREERELPPAQIPSRTPAPERQQPVAKKGKITEAERSLARMRGMSDEDYIKFRDAEPTFVTDPEFNKKGGK